MGRITPTGSGTPSALPPDGAASGDLSGTYPSPTVAKLRSYTIETGAPSLGDVLIWDSTKWAHSPFIANYISDAGPPGKAVIQAGTTVAGGDALALRRGLRRFTTEIDIQPSGPGLFVGVGTAISSSGLLATTVNASNWRATQIGDAATTAPKVYSTTAHIYSNEGTLTLFTIFKTGSDVSTTNHVYWIGLCSSTTMTSADPSGDLAGIRCVIGTDTNWMVCTKDGTTLSTPGDTGTALAASTWYAATLTFNSSTGLSVKMGSSAVSPNAAVTAMDADTVTTVNTNLPRTSVGMYLFAGMQRPATASANQHMQMGCLQLSVDGGY